MKYGLLAIEVPVPWVSVSQPDCLSVTQLRCAKTAKMTERLVGVESIGGPRNIVIVLDGVQSPLRQGNGKWGKILSIVKYRHIAHIRYGLCLITLTSCYEQANEHTSSRASLSAAFSCLSWLSWSL